MDNEDTAKSDAASSADLDNEMKLKKKANLWRFTALTLIALIILTAILDVFGFNELGPRFSEVFWGGEKSNAFKAMTIATASAALVYLLPLFSKHWRLGEYDAVAREMQHSFSPSDYEIWMRNLNSNMFKSYDFNFENHFDKAKVSTASINKNALQKISNDIERKYKKNIGDYETLSHVENQYSETKIRLIEYIALLKVRTRRTMITSISFTVVAVIILSFAAFPNFLGLTPINNENFLAAFLPKLSVSILIQTFAYFFLRVYRSGLEEIRYIQNEMTNIEMTFLALTVAIRHENKAVINKLIEKLSNTERNFVLKKGESTVELDKIRTETIEGASLKDITAIIKAAKEG
ncbi:MAG: hypothetical protein JKY93_01065 [Gammaproteobacteria bacterium]|nr:hypothetical protein [Gammaproteobacteria bacterium]